MVSNSTSVQRHCLSTKSNAPRPDILATQTKQTQTDNIYYTYISLKKTHSQNRKKAFYLTSYSKKRNTADKEEYFRDPVVFLTCPTGGPYSIATLTRPPVNQGVCMFSDFWRLPLFSLYFESCFIINKWNILSGNRWQTLHHCPTRQRNLTLTHVWSSEESC